MENSSNDKGLGLPATPSGSPLQVLAEDGSGLSAAIPKPPAHRPLKFRAWWKNKMMLSVGALYMGEWDGSGEPERKFTDYTPKQVGLAGAFRHGDDPLYLKLGFDDAKDCVLMQYTGLKDKNGKEIYEGDVLGAVQISNTICHAVVEYANATFLVRHTGGEEWTDRLMNAAWISEVIGNIYENPELLATSNP